MKHSNVLLLIAFAAAAAACGKKEDAPAQPGNIPNPNISCPAGLVWNGSACVPQNTIPPQNCPNGWYWNGSACIDPSVTPPQHCPDATYWNGSSCVDGTGIGGVYANGFPSPGGNVLARCQSEFNGDLLQLQGQGGVQVCRIGQLVVDLNYPQGYPNAFKINRDQDRGGYCPRSKESQDYYYGSYYRRENIYVRPGDQIVSYERGTWGTGAWCDTSMDGRNLHSGRSMRHNGYPMRWSVSVDDGREFAPLRYAVRINPYRVRSYGSVRFGFNAATDTGRRGVLCGTIQTAILRCFDNDARQVRCP